MIVNLSEHAGNAALDAVAGLMSGGSIEMLTDGGDLLATLRLSNPAAQAASDGAIAFNRIAEGDALRAGRVSTARVLGADGSEVFLCDVGDDSSDAVIKLNTTNLAHGAPVRLSSFTLAMP